MTPSLLLLNIIFNVSEVLTGIAITIAGYIQGQPCTELLILNGLFWIRCILEGSISAVEYHRKRQTLVILDDDDDTAPDEVNEEDISDTIVTNNNMASTTPLTAASVNNSNRQDATTLLKWKSSVDIFTILLFIIANYFILAIRPPCPDANEMQFYTLHWIILGYIKILFPVFLCGCLLCCPFTMRRMMTMLEEKVVVVPKVLRRKIPKKHWSKIENDEAIDIKDAKFNSDFHTGCSICLDEYSEGDTLYVPNCGHPFHIACLDNWLDVNNICPLCQTAIVKVAQKKR